MALVSMSQSLLVIDRSLDCQKVSNFRLFSPFAVIECVRQRSFTGERPVSMGTRSVAGAEDEPRVFQCN